MSIKDSRVDVRYHRNTSIVLFDTNRHLCSKRCHDGRKEIKPSKSKVFF